MGTIGRKPNDAPLTSADINDGIVTPDDLSVGHPTWTTGGNVGIGRDAQSNRKLSIQAQGDATETPCFLATLATSGDITYLGTNIDATAKLVSLTPSGTGGADFVIQNSAGNDAIKLGNHLVDSYISISTNNTERMRIDSSGHAIIPAGVTLGTSAGVYNAANTLDDYEEGTWTVTFYDASSGGNASPTTGTGKYTKIGNQVSICLNASINNIDTTGMTAGNALFFTLPFASSSYSSGSVSFGGSLTFTNTVLNPICNSGLGLGYFTACSSGNNPVNLLVSGISSGASDFARIDLTYFTA